MKEVGAFAITSPISSNDSPPRRSSDRSKSRTNLLYHKTFNYLQPPPWRIRWKSPNWIARKRSVNLWCILTSHRPPEKCEKIYNFFMLFFPSVPHSILLFLDSLLRFVFSTRIRFSHYNGKRVFEVSKKGTRRWWWCKI